MTRTPLLPQDFEPETAPSVHQPVNPLLLVVALLLILFAASSVLAYNFYRQSRGLPVPSVSPTASLPNPTAHDPLLSPTPITFWTPTPTPTLPAAESISWISPPKVIDSLNIFKPQNPESPSEYTPSKAKFYQVATLPQGQKLILAYVPTQGMGEYNSILRIVVDGSKIQLVPESQANNYYEALLDGNKITTWAYQIPELTPPENLFTQEGKRGDYKKTYSTTDSFDSLLEPVLVQDFPTGSLYYTKAPAENRPSGIYGLNYYFRLKDFTLYKYAPVIPSFGDDQKPAITWADGSVNSTAFNTRLNIGCGRGSMNDNYILSPEFIASKVHAGFMYNQTQPEYEVFQVTDYNHPLVKTLYDNYKIGRETEAGLLSLNDFAAKRNHFIWKDKMGNYLLFISTEFQPMAECGKPVIYLYPQTKTEVSVQVGASITQSEPLYPASGWQVIARPDGQLTHNGQTHPYLFWEGQGNGFYPDYRDRGTLVAQHELVSTLTSQLHQLGLNDKETADFLEFWQPRLPSTPYVRLTWLNTSDVDRLAPLRVSPKPNTNIRLFLEFEGLESPVKLKPQVLTAPPRRGFTLIEWGGLLIK